MLFTVSPNVGLIHHTIIVGGAKQSNFDQYIQELFDCDFEQPLVERQGFDKTHIILDNAPCRKGVENQLGGIIPPKFELVRLLPYSCELNPIEFSFNSVKAYVKRALSQHGSSTPSPDGTTFVSARRQMLLNICPGAIQSIAQAATLNAFYQ